MEKLRASRAKGILIHPYWPLQPWFQEVQQLSAAHFLLPPPHLCVRSHNPGMVEPFVNREVQLRTVSGLRLCVKDEVLQSCVLLATQGDNSQFAGHRRWNASMSSSRISGPTTRSEAVKALHPRFSERWPRRPTSCFAQFHFAHRA
jgi:hypothetical protein